MGLFDKVEHKIESVVNGVFARAFKAEVQPVEIASAIRRAMDDRSAVVGHGRTLVPNVFTIELASEDHSRLLEYSDVLSTELVASAQEHADTQGYSPAGPIAVRFLEADDLDTGVFRVLPTSARDPHAIRPTQVRRRNEMLPPQATAPADGMIGLAGSAAAAATAATAGTAAAGRAPGGPLHRPAGPAAEPAAPHGYRDTRREPADAQERAAREAQRARDLAAWGPDSGDLNPRRSHDEAADDPWAGVERHDPPPTAAAAVLPPPSAAPRRATQRPWLELGHDSYPLLSALTIIGRDDAADITLADTGISRRHCEIRVTHDGPHLVVSIRDLGSTNGTFVDGQRITAATRIEDGSRITVGRSTLTVRLGSR